MERRTIRGILIAATAAGLVAFILLILKTILFPAQTRATSYNEMTAEFSLSGVASAGLREDAPVPLPGRKFNGIAVLPNGGFATAVDTSIFIFSSERRLVDTIALPSQAFCLAASDGGFVYLGMGDHVEVLSLSTGKIDEWSVIGGSSFTSSIAADKNNVFVADSGEKQVAVFDKGGRLMRFIRETDKGPFLLPQAAFDLAVVPGNRLAVTDPGRHRVLILDYFGKQQWQFGGSATALAGFMGCCNPVQIAVTDGGSFVTFEKGARRLKIHDENGEFESLAAGISSFHETVSSPDIAVSSQGEILLLDPYMKAVRIFVMNERDAK